jgi:hypothetical protein
MSEEKFSENLMRMVAAELHVLNALTAAREMYGKSYFSLGGGEKAAIDHAVLGLLAGSYQGITPELLAAHKPHEPMGFRVSKE